MDCLINFAMKSFRNFLKFSPKFLEKTIDRFFHFFKGFSKSFSVLQDFLLKSSRDSFRVYSNDSFKYSSLEIPPKYILISWKFLKNFLTKFLPAILLKTPETSV